MGEGSAPAAGTKFKFPTPQEFRTSLKGVSVVQLSELFAEAGVKKHPIFSEWMDRRLELLNEFHIENDIERLVRWGLSKDALGLSLFLINMSPRLDYFFKEHFGSKRARVKQAKSLNSAATILQKMSTLVPGLPDMMPGNMPSLAIAANAVKNYSAMLLWGEIVYEFMGANSVLEVAKYALAGLVKRTTGKFHDREVSALTGAALQRFDYDETAHRVWRIRTYPRLERTFPIAPKILQALNDVLSHG